MEKAVSIILKGWKPPGQVPLRRWFDKNHCTALSADGLYSSVKSGYLDREVKANKAKPVLDASLRPKEPFLFCSFFRYFKPFMIVSGCWPVWAKVNITGGVVHKGSNCFKFGRLVFQEPSSLWSFTSQREADLMMGSEIG